jgi:hypothetical protein
MKFTPPDTCLEDYEKRRGAFLKDLIAFTPNVSVRAKEFRRCGAMSLRISSHLPPRENSKAENPVALPPGFDKLCTKPWPTGSLTCTNTMGIVRVARVTAVTPGVVETKITSGCHSTSSFAEGLHQLSVIRPAVVDLNRATIHPSQILKRTLERFDARLSFWIASDEPPISTLMRRIRTGCCARAASGQAAALPIPTMNARRFVGPTGIRFPPVDSSP